MLRHINKRGGSERSDINQIDNNHLLTFVLTYFWVLYLHGHFYIRGIIFWHPTEIKFENKSQIN